jgi:hypothetical protein
MSAGKWVHVVEGALFSAMMMLLALSPSLISG